MRILHMHAQVHSHVHSTHAQINFCAHCALASSPGSNAGAGGKREPGIHCLRMRQKYTVNDVTSPYVTRL